MSDPAIGEAGDGWWKSYPADASSVYSMDIESASFVAWSFDNMTYELTRWSPGTGVTKTIAKYP